VLLCRVELAYWSYMGTCDVLKEAVNNTMKMCALPVHHPFPLRLPFPLSAESLTTDWLSLSGSGPRLCCDIASRRQSY
jgi:hypothetical protein